MVLLEIKNLSVDFTGMRGTVHAIQNMNLSLEKGEIIGIVGESGSGKSVTALSILGLLEKNALITKGEIFYKDQDLLKMGKKEIRALRGKSIWMVFQEPMTALHPTMKVGAQLAEVIKRHRKISKKEAYQIALQSLADVHIHDPEIVAVKYPFELSGGMRQRIVIALAMASPPDLLIADEPTTALDVTIQAEILHLMKELNQQKGTSILFITHDLGVVSELCDRTAVMYAGEIVESGITEEVLKAPTHPYTEALLHALPDFADPSQPLQAISGEIPDLRHRPRGCAFEERCQISTAFCREHIPPIRQLSSSRFAACWQKELNR